MIANLKAYGELRGQGALVADQWKTLQMDLAKGINVQLLLVELKGVESGLRDVLDTMTTVVPSSSSGRVASGKK